VVDLDIEKFFDSLDHDLVVKTIEVNTDQKWVLLYVKRWLKAPLQMPYGTGIAEPRKDQRFPPYLPICFCITQWINGWNESSRR
jgi:hypothetical protein